MSKRHTVLICVREEGEFFANLHQLSDAHDVCNCPTLGDLIVTCGKGSISCLVIDCELSGVVSVLGNVRRNTDAPILLLNTMALPPVPDCHYAHWNTLTETIERVCGETAA